MRKACYVLQTDFPTVTILTKDGEQILNYAHLSEKSTFWNLLEVFASERQDNIIFYDENEQELYFTDEDGYEVFMEELREENAEANE